MPDTEAMTAPTTTPLPDNVAWAPQPAGKVWRTIVGTCLLRDDCEFDARPAHPAPPYSQTWPCDGMAVDEELSAGCHVVRYYHKFTDDDPWVEIVFNSEIK